MYITKSAIDFRSSLVNEKIGQPIFSFINIVCKKLALKC